MPHILILDKGKEILGIVGKGDRKLYPPTHIHLYLCLSVHLRVQIESIYLTRLTTQIDLVLVIQCEILHLLEAHSGPQMWCFLMSVP